MGLRIIWATDGSAHARTALPLIEHLLLPATDEVCVLVVAPQTATEGERPDPLAIIERLLPGYQEKVTEETTKIAVEDSGLLPKGKAKIETIVRLGRPASVITDIAEEVGADLIVLGSRGHTGLKSLLLGSVSASVMHDADCSVLIARPGSGVPSHILLATDGSDAASAAERLVTALGKPPGGQVTVLSVAEPYLTPATTPLPYTGAMERIVTEVQEFRQQEAERFAADAASRLRDAGWQAEARAAFGPAALTIMAEARELGADLIAVGASGMNPVERFFIGSTASRVARGSTLPVLIVRQPA